MTKLNYKSQREEMVENQIRRRGIVGKKLLKAMETVPRHLFVSEEQQPFAYMDGPLPIGYGQTISQPYIVAFMTAVLRVNKTHTILEIGTGCGYQAAVLALLAKQVISLEIVPELAHAAEKRLKQLGYDNVEVFHADGHKGWPERAPYNRIMGTAAPVTVPDTLVHQLAPNGRMIIPVGRDVFCQNLQVVTKDAKGNVNIDRSLAVRFVPMVKKPS